MFDILLFIFEVFINALSAIGSENIWQSELLKRARQRFEGINKLFDAIRCLLFGTCLGFIGVLIFPHRMFQYQIFQGVSLIIVPITVGILMHYWGKYLLAKRGENYFIATFSGGALFAFGASLFRFIWLAA